MATRLPDLSPGEFGEGLTAAVPGLAPEVLERLWIHYRELRSWSRRLSLVGPGTAADAVVRHFAESLVGLEGLPDGEGLRVADVGSGAGFPGLVLAAARPDWDVTLVEPREKKRAFLAAVSRKAGLSCRLLGARVEARLPDDFPAALDAVTIRALRLPIRALEALAERLALEGSILLWQGRDDPELPAGFGVVEERSLPGADVRRLLVCRREPIDR